MSDIKHDGMGDIARRSLVVGGVAVGVAVGIGAAACGSSGGSQVNANASDANDLQDQQEKLTIGVFNEVNKIPEQQYPVKQLASSLEMRNLKKKLLMFNDANKLGWVYLLSMGVVLVKIPCMGKVSSTQSAMTTDELIYKRGSNNEGNVLIKGPGDDMSFGPNEGGDRGIFFFTPEGGYVSWAGDWLYTDFEMSVDPNGRLTMGSTKPTRSAV